MMAQTEIKDPFSGLVFHIDVDSTVDRCRRIYERNGKNHDYCPFCEDLQARADAEALLGALDPISDPDTIAAQVEFAELDKPWGEPCAGPDDTLPPEEETGFSVVED
jgi:hypothetical protein